MLLATSLRLGILAVVVHGLRGQPSDDWRKLQATLQNSTLPNDEAWFRKLQMVTIAPKIRGGNPCPEDRFPYMVSIRNRVSLNHICGGILLNRFWVLTAAHCLGESGQNPAVVAGTNLLNHGGQGQELFVTRSILHPDFTGVLSGGNDIALLELLTPATKVKTFANLPDEDTKYGRGHELLALGWGTDGNEVQDSLDCSQALQVVGQDRCQELWSATESNPFINAAMVCAFSPISDTCKGDSGGPLIDAQSPGGKFSDGKPGFDVIGGLTSFGASCGDDDLLPGVYTFLPPFRKWILETMSSAQSGQTNEGDGSRIVQTGALTKQDPRLLDDAAAPSPKEAGGPSDFNLPPAPAPAPDVDESNDEDTPAPAPGVDEVQDDEGTPAPVPEVHEVQDDEGSRAPSPAEIDIDLPAANPPGEDDGIVAPAVAPAVITAFDDGDGPGPTPLDIEHGDGPGPAPLDLEPSPAPGSMGPTSEPNLITVELTFEELDFDDIPPNFEDSLIAQLAQGAGVDESDVQLELTRREEKSRRREKKRRLRRASVIATADITVPEDQDREDTADFVDRVQNEPGAVLGDTFTNNFGVPTVKASSSGTQSAQMVGSLLVGAFMVCLMV